MGFYLNPSDKGFWKSVRSEIYVDKTGLIACTNKVINTEEQYICVSRPRRFGKSMALKMLAAYYSRGCASADLFKGFQIERDATFREHLNQYNVIFLNMQQFMVQAAHGQEIDYLEQEVVEELLEEYGALLNGQKRGLAATLRKIYAKTEKQFIFLIDEWDCVMRERQEAETMQKQYLDFLRDLLKDQPYVALAYMTGILPVKKYGQHSALNMFWEYSMTDPFDYEAYTGFTENEVSGLCERYGMDFAQISNWYDGYQFRQFRHVYNPRSVVAAMKSHVLSNYWTSTETYEALKIYIDMDFDGLRSDIVQMLGGARIRINTFSFQNDMRNLQTKDDVLTLLVHLGYLGYDAESREAFIPNKEILGEFENAMSVNGWANVMQILKASEQLLEDTLQGNTERVARALDKAHTQAASILTYNDENSLSCAIGLAYYSARKEYRLIRELPTGKGYADIVFLPLPCVNKPALVVELKYHKTAHAAIQQIKDRQYTQALEGYTGELIMVGINYDKDRADKPHSCVIERYRKPAGAL
ncbi:MAG: ATP-binding protein [Lachnospiraceae bacterium]